MKTVPANRLGFGTTALLIAVVVVAAVAVAAWPVYSKYLRTGQTSKDTGDVIMIVAYVGGLCASGDTCRQEYKLFEDGTFQQHTKLSKAEVSQLNDVVAQTDFLAYTQDPDPTCPSASDGQDQVLAFPQKYPDKSFKLCALSVPKSDSTFIFINGLIQAHQIR